MLWYTSSFEDVVVYSVEYRIHIFDRNIYMRTAALDSVCGLYVRQFYDPMKIPLGSNSLSSVTSSLVGGSAFFKFGATSSSQPTFSLISAIASVAFWFALEGI